MSKMQKIKAEIKEVFAISLFFFTCFFIFLSLKKAFLSEYDITYYGMGTAVFGALLMGKVVVIFDQIPLIKSIDHKPKIYPVLFRSGFYLVGYAVVVFIEHVVKGVIHGEVLNEAMAAAVGHMGTESFLISLLALFFAFFLFNGFWVLRNHLGPKALMALYFSSVENEGRDAE